MNTLIELFITFFRIGAFTLGGGYVMLPLIQREVVENKKWATDEEILDCFAIGQSTPGIIAVNTSTYIGYKVKKIPGAIASTLGMITPSLICIIIIASFFTKFQEYKIIQNAFAGIRVAVLVLLINAIVKMVKKTIKDKIGLIIAVCAFIIIGFTNISSIWVVIASISIGIINSGVNKNDLH